MTVPAGRLDLRGGWLALEGPVHGLAQPALVATVELDAPGRVDLAELDAAMLAFLPEPLPAGPGGDPTGGDPGGRDPGRALVARLVHWAGAIQRQHRIAVSERLHVEPLAAEGGLRSYRIYMPYLFRDAAIVAFGWARISIGHYLAHGTLAEADAQVAEGVRQRLARALEPYAATGINMPRFMAAAQQLDIPAVPVASNLVQLGIGRGSRLFNSSLFDTTGAVGVKIARDKFGTALLLRRAGLPGAVHARAGDAEQAVSAAEALGYPVVIKPNDQDQGRGVAAGLVDAATVRAAFLAAAELSRDVLVERHAAGADYRMTVLDGEVLQVIGRRPGGVTGDGRHTLAELVAIEGARPENRRRQRDFALPLLQFDDEARALAGEQGLAADDVVGRGRFVPLRRRGNVSSGGVPTSISLEAVHPDNLELAVRAAAALRLNLAGVDLITPDISRSWLETGALVCEVNGQPQISQTGSAGIYARILRSVLGERPVVPIWAHVSDAAPRGLAGVRMGGAAMGTASREGIWIDGRPVAGPQPDGFAAARALFAHPGFDAAMVHLTAQDILRRGLPFPWCVRAVVEGDGPEVRQALDWLRPHVRGEIIRDSQDAAASVHELARVLMPMA